MPLKTPLKFLPVDLLPQHGLEPAWTQSLEPVPADDATLAQDDGPLDSAKAGRERIMDCFKDNCLTPFG